jgi:hypothetical protein
MSLEVSEENWVMIGNCTTQVVESIQKYFQLFYWRKTKQIEMLNEFLFEYFKVIVVPVMEKFSLSRSIKAVNAMYECASLSITKRIGLATARKYFHFFF